MKKKVSLSIGFKWKCENWIVYFKRLTNFFHFCDLIVEKLNVFNSHSIFPIVSTNFTLGARFDQVF